MKRDEPEPAPFRAVWDRLRPSEATLGLRHDVTVTDRTLSLPTDLGGTPRDSRLPHISLGGGGTATPGTTGPRGPADLEITGLLGEGGMGRVHLARQRSLGRDVAVKTIKPVAGDTSAADGLLREAIFMGYLEHPSIIPVHALGCDDGGHPVLVMKRVEGVSWRELLMDSGHAAWTAIDAPSGDRLQAHLQILTQVCNALELAHRRGIIHRDIKPANVMVGEFGEVYLADFGIAMNRVSDEGSVASGDPDEPSPLVGTPAYMSPEMASGQLALIDERTDVYLLGATLHEVLTGKRRHEGATLYDVLLAAYESAPHEYDGSVPPELAEICNRATSRDRSARHPSAQAFRQAIREYLRHRGSVALSDAANQRLAEIESTVRGGPRGPGDHHDERRLMTECRFGFMQAQREWAENPVAAEGLQRCVELMIAHEILQGNGSAARALLDDLIRPRPELEERVIALEADARMKALRDEELSAMKRDVDITVSAPARAVLLATTALMVVAISVTVLSRSGPLDVTPAELIGFSVAPLVVLSIATAVFRARLLANAVSQKLVLTLLLSLGGSAVNRSLGVLMGTPVDSILVADLLLVAAEIGVLGLTTGRTMLIVGALPLAGAVLSAVRPDLIGYTMGASFVGSLAGMAYVGWRRR